MGWDSNPRGLATWRFSRPLVSTTHAPIRNSFCTMITCSMRCYHYVMEVFVSDWVQRFLQTLDESTQADAYRLIQMLRIYGNNLKMPEAKPIGGGLWELRRTGRPQVRILYGFSEGRALLVHGVKKQRSALRPHDIALAHQRLQMLQSA